MIGVHEEVGSEHVVIPYEAVLEILAPSMEGGLGKVLIGNHAVEEMHEGVYTRYLCQRPPRMFLAKTWIHQRIVGGLVFKPRNHRPVAFQVSVAMERDTSFSQEAVTIFLCMVIVTRVAITNSGE